MIKTIISDNTINTNNISTPTEPIQEPILTDTIKPVEEEEESLLKNINIDELIDLIAELVSSFRYKTPEGRRMFKERYGTINRIILTLIGFDKALRKLPAMSLKPEYTVLIGLASLGVTAFFIKVDESPYLPKPQPMQQINKQEQVEDLSPLAKEVLNKIQKNEEISQEEIQKFVEVAEEAEKEGSE
jgi:hypothetical protein